MSPDVVFHGGSFGEGLRAVRAQIGTFFVKKKQKKLEGGAGKGGFGGRVVK